MLKKQPLIYCPAIMAQTKLLHHVTVSVQQHGMLCVSKTPARRSIATKGTLGKHNDFVLFHNCLMCRCSEEAHCSALPLLLLLLLLHLL